MVNKNYILKPRKIEYTKEDKKIAKLKELKPYLKYYSQFKLSLIFLAIFLLISGAISIIIPIISGKMLAYFTSDFNAKTIFYCALMILILEITFTLIHWFVERFWQLTNRNSTYKMITDMTKRLNAITQSSFDNAQSGVFTTRIYTDVGTVSRVPSNVIDILIDALTQVGFISYTFYLNLYIGLFMIGFITIKIVFAFIRINIKQKNNNVIRKDGEQENSFRNENIRGIKDIKSINATDAIVEKSLEYTRVKTEKEYYSNLVQNNFNTFTSIIAAGLNLSFIVLCLYLLVNNQIEIAMFIIAYNYKGRINNFANIIVRAKSYMSECLFAAQHLNEIFDESKYPIEHFGDKTLTDVKGIIEFKNVSFGYNDGSNVLNNINLTFSPNKVSAIVGLSGAGKSTIVSLINRLYDIKDGEGEILLDGTNIKELTRNSLRTNICCITQSPYIYNMTVRENLLLAKTDATEEEIISALKDANIYDFIEKLEEGLDSTLGENGVKLSGGQKQRIAIARAILKNSKVIMFDEATSALDNINQAEIKKTISYLAKEHTVVVIAHRLSTIVDADNIIFIKDGNVFAQGKHKDLIKTCQDYKNLYIEEETDLKEDEQ